MTLPLAGIRVLDLTMYFPGPFATQILADFGAEVIKVEALNGEYGRWQGPQIANQSSFFYALNRNKKSMCINLKKTEGKDIFTQLVKNADVLIEQYRPGVMEKFGLGYKSLKKVNSRLIYCAISGYGHSGPLQYTAGHDLNYLSLAGVTGLTGTADRPVMSGVQIADIAGGALYAVIVVLLALIARKQTGEGQFCDVSMLDGAISILFYALAEWSAGDGLPQRGNEILTGGYACYNIYPTKDGRFISLGAIEHKFWQQFCVRIDRPGYIQFQWEKSKQPEIIKDITNLLQSKNQHEWVEFFANDDICLTPVLSLEEMSIHPQVEARKMIICLHDFLNSSKDMYLTGIPVKLSATPGEVKPIFPELGEHTEEVLLAAGYTHDEVKRLKKQEIIK